MAKRISRLKRVLITLAGLACLVLAGGCEEAFPPETLVERLRVLAVRAEPAEVGISDTVQLTALVADPLGQGRPLSASWAVCMFDLDGSASDIPCPGPDSYVIPSDGLGASLSMPALLAWLEQQGYLDQIPDPTGQDLEPVDRFPLFVGLEVKAGQESFRAVKRVMIRLQGDADPNSNPRLDGLLQDGIAVEDLLIQVPAEGKVTFDPLVADGSQELFFDEDEQEERQEDHLFSWFSDGGRFEDQRTILDDDHSGIPLQVNRWRAPEEPGAYKLWLVVRDGRYGIDWLEYTVQVSALEQ